MHRAIALFISATWRWSAALCSLALVPAATAAPPTLLTTATGRLATLTETYVTEVPNGSAPHIELVAVGRTRSGRIEVARARLPASIRREPAPHRIARMPGEASWEACWRIVDHGRPGGAIGCLRRRIRGNNHPDLRYPPEAHLNAAWSFDLVTQTFACTLADPLPVPRTLPIDAPWTNRAFYIPLPLQSTTPAVLKRGLRARGADISPTSESATALILPDRADICAFDRASRPSLILPALRRNVPVLYERTLDALLAPPL